MLAPLAGVLVSICPATAAPSVNVQASSVSDPQNTPAWVASLKRVAERWLTKHPRQSEKLPFDSYSVSLEFPGQWPTAKDVSNAPFRHGQFVTVVVKAEGHGASLSQTKSYTWASGRWVIGARHTRRFVSLRDGVGSYVEMGLNSFCRWAPGQLK